MSFFKILFLALLISLPNFAQSPYSFDLDEEAVFYGAGITLGIVDNQLLKKREPLTIVDLGNLSKNNINSFDKMALNNWSPTANVVSDVLLIVSIASPLFLLTSSDVHKDIGIYSNMYIQNVVFSYSLAYLAKANVYRLRPYVYNENVSNEEKLSPGSTYSFFSGHSTMAFSSAIFLSTMFHKYHPASKLAPYIWATSLALASTVGYLRIYSGQHFPSDVIIGAVVGSLVGYLVPLVHENHHTELNVVPEKIRSNKVFTFNINF